MWFFRDRVHNLADITQTSDSLGIHGITLTFSLFLFCLNPLQDGRFTIPVDIFSDVVNRVVKTITDLF
jgi:hypothetical protein